MGNTAIKASAGGHQPWTGYKGDWDGPVVGQRRGGAEGGGGEQSTGVELGSSCDGASYQQDAFNDSRP